MTLVPHVDLLDSEDVALALGVSRRYVATARDRGAGRWATFPAPWATFGGSPVWLRRDVEAWRR